MPGPITGGRKDHDRSIRGPLWAARNWSADAGAGSIHDDGTAAKLGFRGGTVAGDVHMNQFPPVLHHLFGDVWFERGHLSLYFRNATVDLERVRVLAEPRAPGQDQVRVWMEREDGLLVCEGTAGVGDCSASALRSRDRRACDPAELRILNRLHAGMSLGHYEVHADPAKQFHRYDTGVISDAHPWYRSAANPWGEVLAAPCTFLEYLWAIPMQGMSPHVGEAVGLFGAIECSAEQGPLLLNRDYVIDSEVLCVGNSPKTEIVWYETTAKDRAGTLVARLLMQSRVLKASSPPTPGRPEAMAQQKKIGNADLILDILQQEGVEYLFGFPNNRLFNAAAARDVRPLIARTERVAINMADAYTRMHNGRRVGAVAVQDGPGVEASFPAVAQAYGDNTPILMLPGAHAPAMQDYSPSSSPRGLIATSPKPLP